MEGGLCGPPLRREGGGEEDQSTYHQKAPILFPVNAISSVALHQWSDKCSGEYFHHLYCGYGQDKVLFTFFLVTSGHGADSAAARSNLIGTRLLYPSRTHSNGLTDVR